MKKKGIPHSKQHEWNPDPDEINHVICQKCGMRVHAVAARRGVGACAGIDSASQPEQEVAKANLPKLKPFIPSKEDHGNCQACGGKIIEMPLNTRIGMIACNNRRCDLYRQRLRTFTRKD